MSQTPTTFALTHSPVDAAPSADGSLEVANIDSELVAADRTRPTLTLRVEPAIGGHFAQVLAEATQSKQRARLRLLRSIAHLEQSSAHAAHRDPIHIDDLRAAETDPDTLRNILAALCAGRVSNCEAREEA